jgi:hypothetical protein
MNWVWTRLAVSQPLRCDTYTMSQDPHPRSRAVRDVSYAGVSIKRTGTPSLARNRFTSPTVYSPK